MLEDPDEHRQGEKSRAKRKDMLVGCVYLQEADAMLVSKWGNSLAVRLPVAVVEALQHKEGDQLDIQVEGRRALRVAMAPGARELLARLRKFRGRLSAGFKFDRLEANERG
jgi:antitoxin MazE